MGNRFVCWYLFGVAGCASPILYSTVNTIVKNDSEERAVILVRVRSPPPRRHDVGKLIEVCSQGSMMTFGYRCVGSASLRPCPVQGCFTADKIVVQFSNMGPLARLPNCWSIWCPEMAAWLASSFCF